MEVEITSVALSNKSIRINGLRKVCWSNGILLNLKRFKWASTYEKIEVQEDDARDKQSDGHFKTQKLVFLV